MDLQYLEEVVRKQLYLESELCRKKVTDAIRVIKNKIDLQDRRLDRYRQVCVLPMLCKSCEGFYTLPFRPVKFFHEDKYYFNQIHSLSGF